MKRAILWMAAAALVASVLAADAQISLTGIARTRNAGGIAPACSNSADFSNSCNSGIAAAIIGGYP